MAEARWTNEQLEAITEKDCNLLVAAAAGAGKTAVLVERIIRKITCEEHPVDIDRLLVVTFTNAAATEMRERIADAISKALDKNPRSILLQRQLALLNKANITTIHSFCMEVIRNNFHYIGLNPGFRISDETEAILMKIETLDDMFDEIYDQDKLKEEFFDLLESYGGNRDDQALKNMILTIYEFIQSYPWPEDWLNEKTGYFNLTDEEDFAKTLWGRVLLKNTAIELMSLKEIMEKAITIIEASEGLNPYLLNFQEEKNEIESLYKTCKLSMDLIENIDTGNIADHAADDADDTGNIADHAVNDADDTGNIADHANDDADYTGNIVSADTGANASTNASTAADTYTIYGNIWDVLYNCLLSFSFKRLPPCKKDVDKEQQERVKSIRDDVKKRIKKLQEDIFTTCSKDIIADLQHVYPLLKYLSELVIKFGCMYAEKKREKSLLDFNDLEHFCLDILTEKKSDGSFLPSDVAVEYKHKFEEILIDEYQDSNLVQEIILNVISRNDLDTPNIFMVGDVKQSIYRFRQAKPELFLEKYNTYSLEKGNKYRKIQLYKNFRSRREVIDSINFIFTRIMSEDAGELNYDENEALNPGAFYEEPGETQKAGGTAELHLIELESEEGENTKSPHESDGIYYSDTHENDMPGANASDNYTTDNYASYTDAYNTETPDNYQSDTDMGDSAHFLYGEEPLDNIQCEARVVAERIKRLFNSEDRESGRELDRELDREFSVYDKNSRSYRPIEYRDIVILLRSTKTWSDVFVEELTRQGIPVYADTGTGFFKTVEVQIILSLLQVIDNPLQDIPLLAVLRSPFVAFTPDELADIRLTDREAILYEALRKFAGVSNWEEGSPISINGNAETENAETGNIETGNIETGDVETGNIKTGDVETVDVETDSEEKTVSKLKEKTVVFLETLEKWRDKALYMSTDELIWYLYTETGFFSYVGAMPGGEQRQANLRMLFEQAAKFEETSYKGLFNFVNFINRLRSGRGDMGSAKILGENENVVRIMSIHKSKGLEFPVVILSGCGKGFNLQDMNKSIILHQELGFGPDYVDIEKRIAYPTLAKEALRYQIKVESLSEEMRILYVGFTRAREKLILTGTVKNLSKSISRWREFGSADEDTIPGHVILRGRNYLDWICSAIQKQGDGSPITAKQGDSSLAPETNYRDGGHPDLKLWDISVWRKEDIIDEDKKEKQSRQASQEILEEITKMSDEILTVEKGRSNYYDEIQRRLGWEYKYYEASRIPIKVSVTELKRRFSFDTSDEYKPFSIFTPTLIKKPAFLEESKGLSAAEIGTVLHFVMQHLNLNKVGDVIQIKSQVDVMVEKGLLTKQQAKSINLEKVYGFFSSPIGRRMLNSTKIYREVPFNIQVSYSELFNNVKDNIQGHDHDHDLDLDHETVLLQGVIDCFFEEHDELVLLDYKTDYILPGAGRDAIMQVRERYRTQIQYYTMVLEKLLHKRVKEKYVYLFWNGEIVEY